MTMMMTTLKVDSRSGAEWRFGDCFTANDTVKTETKF